MASEREFFIWIVCFERYFTVIYLTLVTINQTYRIYISQSAPLAIFFGLFITIMYTVSRYILWIFFQNVPILALLTRFIQSRIIFKDIFNLAIRYVLSYQILARLILTFRFILFLLIFFVFIKITILFALNTFVPIIELHTIRNRQAFPRFFIKRMRIYTQDTFIEFFEPFARF